MTQQNTTSLDKETVQASRATSSANTAQVIPLRPPTRWHDPLQLIQDNPPSQFGRLVLWSVSVLVLILIVWAAVGQLDVIATAEGKLVPQTLVKIVQPAEAGVIKELLVNEGDSVKAGQVIARLDTTLAKADQASITTDLRTQEMQVRRIEAELRGIPMQSRAGDDMALFKQVFSQYTARRSAMKDSLAQETSLLQKAEHEFKSAMETQSKFDQLLPSLKKTAANFTELEKDGIVATSLAAEKQRAAIEAQKNLDAQQATVAALNATMRAQQKRLSQLHSNYQSDLQKELAELKHKIGQLKPTLEKSNYKQGQLELHAPQDGTIKDIATTTLGAVVQPGSVIMTLVPNNEQLYADVNIKNEDVGFIEVGQKVQIKLATYPFQRYGLLTGKIIHISADANEQSKSAASGNQQVNTSSEVGSTTIATYKARIQLDQQVLVDAQKKTRLLNAGMQAVAEIYQGKRSVMEYLLSPVQRTISEAARER